MLKFIKQNWFIAVISGAVGSIITTVIVNHWYSKSISDIITSWVTAISSFAVVIFAGLAYKYATKQYMENEKAKLKFDKKYSLVCEINDYIYNLYIDLSKIEAAYSGLNNIVEQQSYVNIPPESEIIMLENNLFINCDKRAYIFGSLLFNNSALMKLILNDDERKTIHDALLAIHELNKGFIASNYEKIYIPLKVVFLDKGLTLERIRHNIQIIQKYRTSTIDVNNKFIELVQLVRLL